MIAVMFILEAVLLTAILKATLFWIYLWQLKEYRIDRFLAEYGSANKLMRFWIGSGGRRMYIPRFTVKVFLITVSSFLIIFILFSQVKLVLPNVSNIFFYFGAYFLTPFVVFIVVTIFRIPIFFIRQLVYFLAGRKIRALPDLTVVGITGSYGKSSTKEFLAQLLAKKFKTEKTPGNVNTELGIAWYVLRNLKPETEIFVAEIGAYRKGEIATVCRIISPRIAILTGISLQHGALFGSEEAIQEAKFELIENLPEKGLAIFNGEDKKCVDLAAKWHGKTTLYKLDPNLRSDLPNHYRLNLSGAVAAARHLGMSEAEIKKAVENVRVEGRMMKSFIGRRGALIIDDTYSLNPHGVLAALDYISRSERRVKIVVMPCIIELGVAGARVHREIGKKISEVCDVVIVITPDFFSEIQESAHERARLVTDSQKVIEFLDSRLNSESVVLLEGRLSQQIVDFVR